MTIAALPMYDWPELTWATDAFWDAIAEGLRARGVAAPTHLDRTRPRAELWRDPDMLFSQTCGAPLVAGVGAHAQLVATPIYDAPYCDGPTYASAIVTRRGTRWSGVETLGSARVAVNDLGSLSGWWLLRAAGPAPAERVMTGAHRLSARAVAAGDADAAAIDAVAWAYLQDFEPETADALAVIAVTPSAPALPFITAAHRSPAERDALRGALLDVLGASAKTSSALAEALAALRLNGVQVLTAADYAPLAALRPAD